MCPGRGSRKCAGTQWHSVLERVELRMIVCSPKSSPKGSKRLEKASRRVEELLLQYVKHLKEEPNIEAGNP